jgi:hypothetical protein
VSRRIFTGIEDQLRNAVAVAQMDKQESAKIAPAMHPSHQHNLLTDVIRAQFSAAMRAS